MRKPIFRTSAFALTLISLFITTAFAGEPVVWEINSRAELLKGEARGVSITDNGVVTLAPRLDRVFDTEQPYIWSTAVDAAGNLYLGTGHDGKLFRVTADGRGALLYKAAELDVTALAIAKDGALFAATSPDGKVYRVTSDGKAEVYFDPDGQIHLVSGGHARWFVGGGDRRQWEALSRASRRRESRSISAPEHEPNACDVAGGNEAGRPDCGNGSGRAGAEDFVRRQSIRFVRRAIARDSCAVGG